MCVLELSQVLKLIILLCLLLFFILSEVELDSNNPIELIPTKT